MEGTHFPGSHLVCDTCWNGIFSAVGWKAATSDEGYSYKTTWEAIRAAAGYCTWCRFLSRSKPMGEIEISVKCAEDSDCTPAGEKILNISSGADYYMYTNDNNNAAKYIAARERVRDLTSPESYNMALECVKNCIEKHSRCPKPREESFLPDRVIDCTDTHRPKLILTKGQRGRYIALSYVWGAEQPMMTTTQNVERYCVEGLDMKQLPQTIQDAVIVTHNLGERYLWIDAQCILQDSAADKARQLGMMSAIYLNSYLTINAACAEAATQGFLQRERPKKVPNALIPYRCPDGTIGTVWIAKKMDSDINDASHSYWDEIEPVSYRGWCMQERLLPPRSLIYASDTLKYYCQTETVNIGNALCEPSTGMRLPNAIYWPQSTPLSGVERKIYRQSWLAVLFVYTLRAISVPTDKLPALAGVVEQFQRVYQDEYLAGLWRKTLLLDLLWKTGDRQTRPKEYRAPSWSWAAVDGYIDARYIEENLSENTEWAQILHCEVTLKNREVPFGEVIAGFLRVRGYLKEVCLEPNGSVQEKGAGAPEIGHIHFDVKDEGLNTAYYVVPLWSSLRAASIQGLVLVRAYDDQYRRIGRFSSASGVKEFSWMDGLKYQEITIV